MLISPRFRTKPENHTLAQRYLIFRPPFEAAQGVGNLMNGLLAAHLLGEEFERIVCVSHEWQDFLAAFEILNQNCLEHQALLASLSSSSSRKLWLLDFSKVPVNECELKRRLQGPDPVITLVANTYPQWPTTTSTALDDSWPLEQWYRRKFSLPWDQAPATVVHLRQSDTTKDFRPGMDRQTWTELGIMLPRNNTYLVTNQVDLYTFFEANFGWSHPPWRGIQHSAIANIQWTSTTATTLDQTTTIMSREKQQQQQLWADWWTIYQAKNVYHTHSDFSRSATRWSRISSSYTIAGLSTNRTLLLKHDKDDKEPFSQRTQLQHCDLQSSGLDGLGYVLNLDDEVHDDLIDDWKTKGQRGGSMAGT